MECRGGETEQEPKKPEPRRGSPRLRCAACAIAAGTLLLYLGERFVAERHPVAALLTYAPQVLYAVLPGVLFLAAALRRDRRTALVSGATVAFCVVALMGLRVPVPGGVTAAGEPTLRVMTLNVEKWAHGTDAVARAVRDISPDVLCLQEAGRYPWLTGPQQEPDTLAAALPKYRFRREGEIMIGSRRNRYAP